MKYVSCNLIEHGLDFAQEAINFCCRTTTVGGGFKTLIDDYHGELLDLEKFFALKREYRNKMKSGEGIPECINCIYLEEKDYDDDDYISFINFNHGLNCNLKCIYCPFTIGEKSNLPEYDVYPVIKHIAENGYLKPNGEITIAGGEPTLYKSFSDLIKLFMEYDIRSIRILTNGVIYSPVIAEAIEKEYVNIMVSIDAGTREMYKWIKSVDCYDRVWENISKYALAQKDKDYVKTKYIIIPGINDSKDEVAGFINQSKNHGVKTVAFDIELNWYGENMHCLPREIFDFVEYTIEETKNQGLGYEPIDRVVAIIQKLKKEKNIQVSFRGHEI